MIGKGYIVSSQHVLMGHDDIIGFGDGTFRVIEIDRDFANFMIENNHYSGTYVNNSTVHLGVLADTNTILGVLQFGYAMNPASMGQIVAGTKIDEYLELNRMWLDDKLPRNSESKAISYALKYIKRKRPSVKWVQSFADERCGRLGVVYQAANFIYLGEHEATFWEYGGKTYHNSMMTRAPEQSPKAAELQKNAEDAIGRKFRQFRYIYFLDRAARKKLLKKVHPYPKPMMDQKAELSPVRLRTYKGSNTPQPKPEQLSLLGAAE